MPSNNQMRPADEALLYAMLSGMTIALGAIAYGIAVGIPARHVVGAGTIVGIVGVFTVIPHLVAWWLNTPVGQLVTPPDH